MFSNILLFTILYLIVLGPNFVFGDIFYLANFSFFVFSFLYVVTRKSLSIVLQENLFFIFIFLLCSTISFTLNFRDTQELLFKIELLKFVIFSFNSYALVCLYRYYFAQNWVAVILKHLYILCLITAFITIFIFINIPLKSFMSSILDFKLANHYQVVSGIRSFDLSVGGGVALSLLFVLGTILSFEFRKFGVFDNIFYKIGPFIFLISSAITARTGMIIVTFTFVYYLSDYFLARLRFNGCSWRGKEFYFNFCAFSVFLFLLVWMAYSGYFSQYEAAIAWAFEFVLSFGESKSTEVLLSNHYILPNNLSGLVIGDNNFSFPTDVGFLKMIHVGGFLLLFAFVFFFLFYIFNIFICALCSTQGSVFLYRASFVFVFVIFLVNFKELIFTNSRGVFILMMIIVFSCRLARKVKE